MLQLVHFVSTFFTLLKEHPDMIRHLIMSDAHFELFGCVNRQNLRYWSEGNPNEVIVKPLHSPTVTVRSGISACCIIRPYIFDYGTSSAVTVTSDRYVHVANSFFPESRRRHFDLGTARFQQHGGKAPSAQQSKNTAYSPAMATFLGQAVRPICQLVISVCGAFRKPKCFNTSCRIT
jgi:hypothetical protein